MSVKNIKISELYKKLLSLGYKPNISSDGYEVIDVEKIKIKSVGNKFVKLLKLSRHKTIKNIVRITVYSKETDKTCFVDITTDHVCLVYNRDHFLENKQAKDLKINDYVFITVPEVNDEVLAVIKEIKDLGKSEDYVYDCEVDDESHSFYANDILIHNSQFIDLTVLTDNLILKYDLPEKIIDWPQEKKQELWNIMSEFTDNEINKFIRDSVHEKFCTNMQHKLTYELEYLADTGLYESQKHYFVHKIFEEGDIVDKIKVTGISLKKNETDKVMKNFIKDIYEGVVINDWKESDYTNYLNNLYDTFTKFNIDQIAFWKGYGTAKESTGFLQMAKGATQISRACSYHNQIIEKLKLGEKYDQLKVGDKCRFCYILPSNMYGINCIAYKPGNWPKEFNKIFEIDYSTMFTKIILDQLKKFREACKFNNIDPKKQMVQDIFDL